MGYIRVKDGVTTVHCKGCDVPLHETKMVGQKSVQTLHPEYGLLLIGMLEDDGRLSKHRTPCCPKCAEAPDLDAFWLADREEFVRTDPERATPEKQRKWAGRKPLRVLSYERAVHDELLPR